MSVELMKQSARFILLDLFKTKGEKVMIDKAKSYLLESNSVKKQLNAGSSDKDLRGELAECVLECYLRKYVDEHEGTFYTKSLCFETSVNTVGTTEVDMILFTPYRVYVFECKSYAGKKILTDKCTIMTPNLQYPKDIFKQNEMHFKALVELTGDSCLEKQQAYKLAFFSFADKSIDDRRTEENKVIMPVIDENDIKYFMDMVHNYKSEVKWDIQKLYNKIKNTNARSSEVFQKHLQNIKEKYGN